MLVAVLLLLLATAQVVAVAGEDSSSSGGNHHGQCIEKEKEALLSFKRVVDPGNILSSWTNDRTNQNCCTWRGVTCDNQTNHVVEIDFSTVYDDNTDGHDYAIGGEIGSSLVELQYLNYLDFSGTNFSRIPMFIGSLKNLVYLDLSGNPISGTIPPQLGNLTKLQFLDLSSSSDHDQMIADNIEWFSRLTSLRSFRLMNANFTKAGLQSFKVAPSLSSLEVSYCLLPKVDTSSLSYANSSYFLKTLVLQYNSMDPTAISWFLNFSSNPFDLTLTNNIIDGSFPDSFGGKNSLKNVDLSRNEVGSGIPKSLGSLTNIKYLDLSLNNLGGTLHDLLENLTGSTMNSLEVLYLGSNQLGGLILEDEKSFLSLRELYLDNNQLEGPFPHRFSRFPSLNILSLDDNKLSGPLPDLSSMSRLKVFRAANNSLNGTSTESIGELYYLETLDVSSNSLTGIISEVNLRCPKLNELDLSSNSAVTLKFNSSWVPSFQLTSITLTSCKLGPQFPNWLKGQSNLSYLDISNSDISGPVPNWFSNITSKLDYLNISLNLLDGTLPHFPLLNAYRVDLSSNQFQGSIPPSLSNATHLYLSDNEFTDCSSFLCEPKAALTRILDLSNNQLSGSLSDCWGNFDTLSVLKLENNKLSGEIPSSISSSGNYIQTIQLRRNSFSGKLPSSMKNCTELRILDVGENNLNGNVPSWIGERLTALVFLSLKSNKFDGIIPMNLCHLSNIQILDLSQNHLSGATPSCFENYTSMVQKTADESTTISIAYNPIPSSGYVTEFDNIAWIIWKGLEYEYGKILGLLRIIDLSSNKLTGKIPGEMTNLVQLIQLNLSRNDLSGNIPNKIGNLAKLESLDLSHNNLSGKIPISLAEVSSLNYLDLSNNELSGRIPTSTQLQSFNGSSYMGNLELCGVPLTSSCPGDEPLLEDPSSSTRDDESHGKDGGEWFDMSWFYSGIGVGFFVGFCGNLLLSSSLRAAYFQFMRSLGGWLYGIITLKGVALKEKS